MVELSWAGCNIAAEIKSRWVIPMDFEQAMHASEAVQQNHVAPCNYYQLYRVTSEPEDNEITIVNVPEKFVK
jgi:hypothetical protein